MPALQEVCPEDRLTDSEAKLAWVRDRTSGDFDKERGGWWKMNNKHVLGLGVITNRSIFSCVQIPEHNRVFDIHYATHTPSGADEVLEQKDWWVGGPRSALDQEGCIQEQGGHVLVFDVCQQYTCEYVQCCWLKWAQTTKNITTSCILCQP